MPDFLDILAQTAKATIQSGYYNIQSAEVATSKISLRKAILDAHHAPVIAEIKPASPSAGIIRKELDARSITQSIANGGAIGISVLTEPTHFDGSLRLFAKARKATKLPILMKDIILSPIQLDAAAKLGANAVLLIEALFERGYCEYGVEDMIARAHSLGLEVLLETHTEEEFHAAVKTHADLVGINNRDLATLKVDLNTTKKILQCNDKAGKTVVSESGINTPEDVRFLHECGAQAFLIGSAVMFSEDIEAKVKEFVSAL
ncbi:MAG: indole-3-glycerol-phosphate synthase [Candidatus Bathyarchaeota archaeon]|nr:indole-3-glycerol-phosphate synthase [Candidatus Bathyarchaeota archaeon]